MGRKERLWPFPNLSSKADRDPHKDCNPPGRKSRQPPRMGEREAKRTSGRWAKPGRRSSPTCTVAVGFSSIQIVARKQMAAEAWVLNL